MANANFGTWSVPPSRRDSFLRQTSWLPHYDWRKYLIIWREYAIILTRPSFTFKEALRVVLLSLDNSLRWLRIALPIWGSTFENMQDSSGKWQDEREESIFALISSLEISSAWHISIALLTHLAPFSSLLPTWLLVISSRPLKFQRGGRRARFVLNGNVKFVDI